MKRILLALSVLLAVFIIGSTTLPAFAADDAPPTSSSDLFETPCKNPNAAQSTTCQSRTKDNPLVGPSGILTKVVQIIIMITAVAAVIMIMVGGFRYIISTGDSSNINSAKNTILYAIIGLVVAVMGQAIVSFVLTKL